MSALMNTISTAVSANGGLLGYDGKYLRVTHKNHLGPWTAFDVVGQLGRDGRGTSRRGLVVWEEQGRVIDRLESRAWVGSLHHGCKSTHGAWTSSLIATATSYDVKFRAWGCLPLFKEQRGGSCEGSSEQGRDQQ